MKPKLLILPSWYISPEDRVNGSAFQAQAELLGGHFETRVLFLTHFGRPSLKNLIRKPLESAREWGVYLSRRNRSTSLPDEPIFNNPKLFHFQRIIPPFHWQPTHRKIVNDWVECVDDMIMTGWRPDLIRAHTAYPAGVVASRLKSKFGIPYVISEHLPFSISAFQPELRSDIVSAFKNADLVLSLSYDKVRQLAMSGIDVDANIIHNYVDDEFFEGLASPYVSGEPLRLVAIGAASFYKDHKTLLLALRELVMLKVPFHLTLIGLKLWGGDKLEETLGLINSLKLSKNVTIIDRMERVEIAKILPTFNVLTITSIQEGFPNVVLEALASGLFVVATQHGGTEDLINDKIGRIVPIRNYKKIAYELKRIFDGEVTFDPQVIRATVISECGRRKYADRISHHYLSTIAASRC